MRLIDADDLIERINVVIEHGLADPDGLHPLSAEVVLETINVIPTATPEPHWIPVTERLPEIGEDVLFSVAGLYSAEGCLRPDGDWWQFRWNSVIPKERVTAWCTLLKPEPYKEVTE